jgi:CRP-like cAMP-binding protein
MDFSDLMEDAEPAKPAPPPKPDLPRIPLFSSLEENELRRLIEGVQVRDFDPGDTILKQGEPGMALYVIASGRVDVLLEGPPQKSIARLGEGAFFGELSLLTDFPRSATVVADEPTRCLEISRELAAQVIADSPEVLKTLLRFFRDRMVDRFVNTTELFSRFEIGDALALVERFKFLEVEPRTRLVREGVRAPGLFLLLCGDVQASKGGKPIAKMQPGDAFGEMSLLTREPAVANVDTLTKCWVLQLPAETFQEMMVTWPQLLEWVSELADRRRNKNLRGADDRVDML